jgi:hypothetical protein
MRAQALFAFCIAMSPALADQSGGMWTPPKREAQANALMCFKSGEQVSGMNKICYYDCTGSEAAITVKAYQLCPLNIKR